MTNDKKVRTLREAKGYVKMAILALDMDKVTEFKHSLEELETNMSVFINKLEESE